MSQYKHKLGERGGFHIYWDMGVAEIFIGPADDPESEHVLAVHRLLIPELIASLRMALDKGDKQ
jgi:hypothetical protein